MSKSTKSKTPAAPRAKKTAAPKKAAVKKAAAVKKPAAPTKKKAATKKVAAVKKKVTTKKVAKAVEKVAATAKKAVVKKTAAVKKTVAKKTAAAKKPATKRIVSPRKTVIKAKIDIGFGNTMFVRGEGPGLSWDVGLPMNSEGEDTWTATVSGAKSQVIFKFLVNDISWNTGEDYVVDPGSTVELAPTF